MDLILMGKRDARRLGLVQAAIDGKFTNPEGADALQLSRSQFKRLRRRVQEAGAQGIVHGNRGRVSPRRVTSETRDRIVEMLTGVTKLNDHHISDLLEDKEIEVSPATVHRIRQELRIRPKRSRRGSKHRTRRERRARRGAMVLIDGSPFRWFDETGPLWTLHGAIDDATSEILALTLRPTEDLHGYMMLMRDLVSHHGIPAEMYGDRSGILVRNDDHWSIEEELAGKQSPTHFGRMLDALGIRFIAARSPQAKGRIERLWPTLQDRLVAELRLLGYRTLEAVLAYLPIFIARHNKRLAKTAKERASAFRTAPRDLDRLLACTYERVVARDNTIGVAGRIVQIPPGARGRSSHKARVEVRELLEGRMLVIHPRRGLIAEQPSPGADFTLTNRKGPRATRINAGTDARRSPQKDERSEPGPKTPARRRGIGTLTNIRKPKQGHPWKRLFKDTPSTRSV